MRSILTAGKSRAKSHLRSRPFSPVSGLFAAEPKQGSEHLSGTWELNLAKSNYTPGPAPKSQTRITEIIGESLKLTLKGH
jgi:hypothetical protein